MNDPARSQYLAALGIDVWVRRERAQVASRSPTVEPSAPEDGLQIEAPSIDAPVGEAIGVRAREPGMDRVEFVVRCVRFGRVFALIDQPTWNSRRLVLDVARALNGFQPAERKEIRFDWPQIESGDCSLPAAQRALGAFVSGQVGEDDRVVVAGRYMAELLRVDVPEALGSGTVAGAQAVVLGEAMREVEEKRALWQLIRNMR